MLSSIPADNVTIIADLEAGIGTLTRLPDSAVDVTIVVVEPTPRSIDVARRAVDVAIERDQGRVLIIANKVANDDDVANITAEFPDQTILAVPNDDVVDRADREGLSPIDIDPEAPAVAAIGLVAAALTG